MGERTAGDKNLAESLALIENESGTLAVGNPADIEAWITSTVQSGMGVRKIDDSPADFMGSMANALGLAGEVAQVLVTRDVQKITSSSE
ncbi:MAG TPA: hypothetical protein VFC72_07990, partial [Corynebacterium sp.]|nr:hypothetical protein [Corynebacterium sp.]